MSDRAPGQPALIVIKRPRAAGAGHHGGAWKIAYADFVTAMMAFFLLLWLMSTTSEEQRKGISDFFNAVPISAEGGTGADGLLQGRVLDEQGVQASRSPSSFDPSILLPVRSEAPRQAELEAEAAAAAAAWERAVAAEREAFDGIEDALRERLRELPELAPHLAVERTAEGLRIQLLDQERSPMFASGSAAPAPRLRQLLKLVAAMVAGVPNPVAIGGHTDAHPFARGELTNWELSADRANAARRALVAAGLPGRRVARVQGLADREPLVADDPLAAANRRISVLVISNLAAGRAAAP